LTVAFGIYMEKGKTDHKNQKHHGNKSKNLFYN